MKAQKILILITIFVIFLTPMVYARIKLVALPPRDEVLVRLDNPQATLVEEERVLTLQKGANQIDFSWKGVSIDPDSIRLKIISHPKEVKLINVSYPPNEAALVWQIYTPEAYQEKVRISYLLSGIDRLVTYKAVAEKDESALDLQSYLVLRNFSGERFENAKIVLDYGSTFEKTIAHEETKQMLFFTSRGLPIEKTFTWDASTMPWDPEKVSDNVGIPVYYAVANIKEKKLGEYALWGGKGRIFQKDGYGSTIFLGEDDAQFTPVGEKMKFNIGDSRDIVVTQKKMSEKRINLKRNRSGNVVLCDTDEVMEVKIENFKDKPAVLILTERIEGQWDMETCTHNYVKKDAFTLEFQLQLAPKAKIALQMHYYRRNIR